MTYLTFRHLQDELKRRGLPASRPYVLKYEKMGVIKRPSNVLEIHRRDVGTTLSLRTMRIYSVEEIDEICGQIKQFILSKYA